MAWQVPKFTIHDANNMRCGKVKATLNLASVSCLPNTGVDIDSSKLLAVNTGGHTRGHPLRLYKPHASSRVRRNAFAVRVINDWNGLPADVVDAPTMHTFKKRLDSHWKQDWYFIPDTD